MTPGEASMSWRSGDPEEFWPAEPEVPVVDDPPARREIGRLLDARGELLAVVMERRRPFGFVGGED